MTDSSKQTKIKLAQALRLIADVLETEGDQAPVTPSPSEWIDEDQMFVEFGLKRNSADSRQIPRARLGRKNRWKRTDVEAALVASPVTPRAKIIQARQLDGEDPLESLIRSGAVVARGQR